ncbi:Protein mlo2 [Ranunculus cassubicifolius]
MILLFNLAGWFAFLWLPFIPLIIILVIGTKLQVIITKMGLRIQDKGEVVRGVPIVQPNDELFWFGRPRLILSLIHFILFQNAFQLAFFAWTTKPIPYISRKNIPNLLALPTNGIVIQVLCSYVTLPLYALVTQMGSTMKPTIFNERVAVALKKWHHTTKKHTKQGGESASVSPMFSMPSTPTHGNNGTSPVHLLYKHRVSVIASLFLNCNINGILFEEEPDSVIASLFLNCNINGILFEEKLFNNKKIILSGSCTGIPAK